MVNAPIASVPAPDTDVRENDVFISYSRKDKSFIEELCHSLREKRISYWVDWENLPGKTPWNKEIEASIEEGIANTNSFLFIMSINSIVSPYCHREIEKAERHKKQITALVLQDNYESIIWLFTWLLMKREFESTLIKMKFLSLCYKEVNL